MRTRRVLASIIFVAVFAASNLAQIDEPSKKLGAFLGKWETEGTFANGDKVSSSLECQWSPQHAFLICEQRVHMASGETRQLTIYAFNNKTNSYSYTTISSPGGKPFIGGVEIKGNVWIYDSSYQADGKTTQIHNTNEFVDPRTEVFKIVSSEDGGAHWKPVLEGRGHKVE